MKRAVKKTARQPRTIKPKGVLLTEQQWNDHTTAQTQTVQSTEQTGKLAASLKTQLDKREKDLKTTLTQITVLLTDIKALVGLLKVVDVAAAPVEAEPNGAAPDAQP